MGRPSIPALTAATALQVVTQYPRISAGVGWGPTILATVISFVVGYFAVKWLLTYIARHTYSVFIVYRIVLGALVLGLVGFGVISAT